MPSGASRFLRRDHPEPEHSVPLRVASLVTVLIAVGAVIAQGALPVTTAVLAIILIPLAYLFSHVRRGERNILLKIVLAFAMIGALLGFVSLVKGVNSVDQARVVLASLFVWVQVIHSFDLPRRRDLAFSIGSSLALMAVAGSLSLSNGFVVFLVPYTAACGLWLYLSQQRDAEDRAGPAMVLGPVRASWSAEKRRGARVAAALGTALAVFVASFAVFLVLPRFAGARFIAPPFHVSSRIAAPGFNSSSAVVNPGLASAPGVPGNAYLADAFPGFGAGLNLTARGQLSDQVVMKVRTTQPALWRGQAYDHFDGTTWTDSNEATTSLGGGFGPPIEIPGAGLTRAPTRQVIQTFFVQKAQPNIVFAAAAPSELYFPDSFVKVDSYGAIRSPIMLDAGMVYSVISQVPVTTPSMLRATSSQTPPIALERQYTQLPSNQPQRDINLAHSITDSAPTEYDKVMAVQSWLKLNTRYNINVPPQPPGTNSVDWFLFQSRQGFCEHIASAMAILLRAVGVPARVAVGFGPGTLNPLTGYYEVRESDAHAWVEVYYPSVGWVEYDPTRAVPDAAPGASSMFIAPQVLRALGRFLGSLIPRPVRAFTARVAAWMGRAAGDVARKPFLGAIALLLTIVALAGYRRLRGKRRTEPLTGAAAAYRRMLRVFERRGVSREPSETPGEHLARVARTDPLARGPDAARVVGAFERERFSGASLTTAEIEAAMSAAAQIESASDAEAGSRR